MADQIKPAKTREPCPVCGEFSYSRGGVHPQCEVLQADAERTANLKRDRLIKAKEKPAKTKTAWQKSCPKCKEVQHLRKKSCACGYTFDVGKKS